MNKRIAVILLAVLVFSCLATSCELEPRTITLKDGIELSKSYDGKPIGLTKDCFDYEGGGEVTIEYKAEDAPDSAYTCESPADAGFYNVRVSVKASFGYAKAVAVFVYTINPVIII